MKDDDLTAEIRALKARAGALRRIVALRREVGQLELEAMGADVMAIAIKTITEEVCRHFNLPVERLFSNRRTAAIALPRQVAFYLIRVLKGAPYKQIALVFNKDHGTIIHGCTVIKNRMDTEEPFRLVVNRLALYCQTRFKKPAV